MNKKFSTLMASVLLAGAALSPSDLLAQIQYATGKTYGNAQVVAVPTADGKTSTSYLVFEEDGIPYVAVVSGNKLVAKPFLHATESDKVVVKKTASGYEVYTTAGDLVGTEGSPDYGFGNVATSLTGVAYTDGSISINYGTAYVNRTGSAFSMGLTTNGFETSFKGKFVNATNLKAITNPLQTPASAKMGNTYVLMAAGKVLGLDDDGENVAFDKYWAGDDQTQYWIPEVVETGTHQGYALLKNKATGEYMVIDGSQAALKLTWNTPSEVYEFVDALNALKLYNPTNWDELSVEMGGVAMSSFALGEIENNYLAAEDLKTIFGESFNVSIKYNKKDVANNPFTGELKPVVLKKADDGNYTTSVKAATGAKFMLQNGDGNFVVMKLTDKYADAANIYGYKMAAVSARELALDLNKEEPTLAPWFKINTTEDLVVGEEDAVNHVDIEDENGSTYMLGMLNVNNKATLSAEKGHNLNYLKALTIKLGKFNKIDVAKLLAKPAFFSIINKNTKKHDNYGKVAGLSKYGSSATAVEASDALLGYPETQWAPTYNEKTNVLTFTNRERPSVSFDLDADEIYNIKGETDVFAMGNDTIQLKAYTNYKESDGFLTLNDTKLKNTTYKFGLYSPVWNGVAYAVENHADSHQIGLSTDRDEATVWKLVPAWYEDYNSLDEKIESHPDTLAIGATLAYYDATDGWTTTDKDGEQTVWLKTLAYKFQNQSNSEYLAKGNNAYVGNEDYGTLFTIKSVGDDKYNLIEAYYTSGDVLVLDNDKMYGGDSASKGILNSTSAYSQTENDLFVLEETDAPEYLSLKQGDIVKIFREEFESNVLYEKGEFAGIGNATEFAKINPALYVDTAYVNREGNNRWDYLLAVNVNKVDTTYQCNVPEHGVHQMDTTYGRFLVNLADSAIANTDIHTNKYIYEGYGWNNYPKEPFAKLGFVEAKHTNDALIVASSNDTIAVGTPDYSLAKFAFRIVDQAAKSFVIETGYKYPTKGSKLSEAPGYLRWINGNLVVTPVMADAEVFCLAADERNATANEAIEAAGVQVIGGKGAVTVQGAAGKVITVANVLGQTIANQVAASDNVTIAVPAGIVVVAVEGEATKVVVK